MEIVLTIMKIMFSSTGVHTSRFYLSSTGWK